MILALLGFAAGILSATLTLLDHTPEAADRELAAALALERQKNEHLTTQVESLLRHQPCLAAVSADPPSARRAA